MSDVEPPDKLDYGNLDQYSDAEIEAWNEQREQEIRERTEELNRQEQAAVDTLRRDAQESHDTATVELGSGVELEVRTRIPPEVEELADQLQTAQQNRDMSLMRRLAAALNAAMVVSPDGYTSTEVWLVASRDGEAGLQWLMETNDTITGPVEDNLPDIEDAEGNSQASSGMHNPQKANHSGWQRQR